MPMFECPPNSEPLTSSEAAETFLMMKTEFITMWELYCLLAEYPPLDLIMDNETIAQEELSKEIQETIARYHAEPCNSLSGNPPNRINCLCYWSMYLWIGVVNLFLIPFVVSCTSVVCP